MCIQSARDTGSYVTFPTVTKLTQEDGNVYAPSERSGHPLSTRTSRLTVIGTVDRSGTLSSAECVAVLSSGRHCWEARGVELDYGWQGVNSESWFLCMSANSTPLWELYQLGGQYFTPACSRQL